MEHTTYTLANGLRGVHLPMQTAIARCVLLIGAGSAHEEGMKHGVAHFNEHIAFKGTQKRSARQIINRLEFVGGDLNAYTARETTAYQATVQARYFSRAVNLLADLVFRASLPAEEIERERKVILDEYYAAMDATEEAIMDEFEERAFPGQALGRNILGTPQSIRSIQADDLEAFRRRYYHPANMVFASAGPFPVAKAKQLVSRIMGREPYRGQPPASLPQARYKPFRHEATRESFQTHAVTGTAAYSLHSGKGLLLNFISNLLGGDGMNSRLNLSLREKHGYSYLVETDYSPYQQTGLFSIYFGTEAQALEKALRLVDRELKKMRTQALGIRQLHHAKQQYIGQAYLAAEDPENQILRAANSLKLHGRVVPLAEKLKRVDEITATEILETANEVFAAERFSTLVYKSTL